MRKLFQEFLSPAPPMVGDLYALQLNLRRVQSSKKKMRTFGVCVIYFISA